MPRRPRGQHTQNLTTSPRSGESVQVSAVPTLAWSRICSSSPHMKSKSYRLPLRERSRRRLLLRECSLLVVPCPSTLFNAFCRSRSRAACARVFEAELPLLTAPEDELDTRLPKSSK